MPPNLEVYVSFSTPFMSVLRSTIFPRVSAGEVQASPFRRHRIFFVRPSRTRRAVKGSTYVVNMGRMQASATRNTIIHQTKSSSKMKEKMKKQVHPRRNTIAPISMKKYQG